MSRMFRTILPAALLLALAACGGILPTPAPPPQLYRLTSLHDFLGNLPGANVQLVVDQPFATSALDTDRITLSRSPTTIDYFANASWTDHSTVMMQTLLINSLENSGRLAAVGRDPSALQPDFDLHSELRHFEAVYADAGAPRVYCELEVKLVRDSDRSILAQRVFEAHAQASVNSVPAVVDAFDAATHELLGQVVTWTVQNLATARR